MDYEATQKKQYKKVKKGKAVKEAPVKTIKVSTIIKAIVIIVALIMAFIGGHLATRAYDDMIKAEVKHQVTQQLKDQGL